MRGRCNHLCAKYLARKNRLLSWVSGYRLVTSLVTPGGAAGYSVKKCGDVAV